MAPAADNRTPRRGHLVPEISWGNLASIVCILGSVIGLTKFIGDANADAIKATVVIDGRVTAIENDRKRAREDYLRDREEQRKAMEDISRKLDTLLLMNSREPRRSPPANPND